MKEIKLTHGKFALVDDEDYDFLMQWKWHAHNPRENKWYAKRSIYFAENKRKTTVIMHRVIMKARKGQTIDHRFGEGFDNQKKNLRFCTAAQNNANRKSANKNSTSKYLGVFFDNRRRKWVAAICSNYKKVRIGIFANEDDAAIAFNDVAIKIHGQFARLNIIT